MTAMAFTVAGTPATAAASVEITDLGTLPGDTASYPVAINNSGVIVGVSFHLVDNVRVTRAVRWDRDGSMTDLGVDHDPHAINNSGAIVGTDYTSGPSFPRPVEWQPGSATPGPLAPLPGGTGEAVAWTINRAGTIAGWATQLSGQPSAVLWSRTGVITDLGTLPDGGPFPTSMALLINDRGLAVGTASLSTGTHAVAWRIGHPTG